MTRVYPGQKPYSQAPQKAWIPDCAPLARKKKEEKCGLGSGLRRNDRVFYKVWMPACAGMTYVVYSCRSNNRYSGTVYEIPNRRIDSG